MFRTAITSAIFGLLAATFIAMPANAVPASPSKPVTENVVGSVQSIGHRRGYRRGHGSGVRLFLGTRRHGGGWGMRGHGGRAYRGRGHGRRH